MAKQKPLQIVGTDGRNLMVKDGQLVERRLGKHFSHPLAGGAAALVAGKPERQRSTATRVVAGGLIAGPVGAIAGYALKKTETEQLAIVVSWPDGESYAMAKDAKHREHALAEVEQLNAMMAAA